MSKPILEFLEALGIAVKKGAAKMECPSCHEIKLTASEKKNVASCWACGKKFKPGDKREEVKLTWQTRMMKVIAARCQKALVERTHTINYLVNTRHLPNDIKWLQDNGVGAVPPNLPVEQLKEKAEKILAEDMQLAFAGAAKEEVPLLKAKEKAEKDNIDRFFHTLDGVMNSTDVPGAVAFIYTNHHGHVTSINLRLHSVESEGKAKQLRRIQAGAERGLFNPKVSLGSHWEQYECDNTDGLPPIIVEGEFNWLSLLALNDKWAGDHKDAYGLMGCAMGGKDGCDGKEVLATFEEIPLVIYDNDTIQEDGFPAGYDLVRGINKYQSVFCCATIGGCREKDLDDRCTADNINRLQLTEADLLQHWAKAVWLPRPYEEVGKELNEELGKQPNRVDYANATKLLWEDLQDRGECFRVKAGHETSFGIMVITDKDENLRNKNRVVQLFKDHPSWVSLLLEYGIGASDAACNKLGAEISARIQLAKKPYTELYLLSHFNRENGCLYIDELTHVLKLHPDGKVSYIQNGEEGVIFTPAGDQRRAVIGAMGTLKVREGLFADRILNSINWDETKGLTAEQQKQLYKTHVETMFFDTLMGSQASPLFEGLPGGEKNSISVLTGFVFEGKDFNVIRMPRKPEDLDTLTVDRLYVAFDEYDASDEELEGALRSWCTRKFSIRRQLYETWTTSIKPLARGLAMSTNANVTREVATASRLLMFNVLPRQTKMEDETYASLAADLYPEFMKYRNAIWSEIVADLRAMVVHIANTKKWPMTSFRMSDYGSLLLVAADKEGWGGEARTMLLQMQQSQIAHIAENYSIVTIMTNLLLKQTYLQTRFLTQGQWASYLRDSVWDNKQAKDKLADTHLKKMFSGDGVPIMQSVFVMKLDHDKHNDQRLYSFALKAAGVESGRPAEIEASLDDP